MAFDRLPAQAPFISPAAKHYATTIMERSRQAAANGRCVLDVAYGDDYWQRIDIYLPADPALTGLPVVLFLHGGGWKKGYKEDMGFMAPPLVGQPAIFVSVSYRLAPEFHWSEQLDDTIAALAHVHAHIADLGGDPNRIAIGGHSAGGHLSALATLRPELLQQKGLPADVIKYCLPVSAPFEFDPALDAGELSALFSDPDDCVAASPLTYVEGNTTPFFISWADADLANMLRTSHPMIAALEATGTKVDHHLFEGMDHFDISMDHGNPDGVWARRLHDILKSL